MTECGKGETCINRDVKCHECNAMSDIYNHYPCYEESLFELITEENIHTLKPGEWIWDNGKVNRNEHSQSLWPRKIFEPKGFRQIHILNEDFPKYSSKPFMLSDFDGCRGGYSWQYFESNRFYKFKGEVK